MYLWGAISKNMETFDEENPRQRGLRKLLWDIRLIAVIVIGGICYASFEIWNRVFDARLRDMTAREQSAMNRDVANFLSDSTAAGGRTETVRWVNLTIEDIIITSKHPQQLRVEESLVSTDEASISPDDIQNQTSETTAGEGLIPPHLRPRGIVCLTILMLMQTTRLIFVIGHSVPVCKAPSACRCWHIIS